MLRAGNVARRRNDAPAQRQRRLPEDMAHKTVLDAHSERLATDRKPRDLAIGDDGGATRP